MKHILYGLAILLSSILLLTSCESRLESQSISDSLPISFTDPLGNKVSIPKINKIAIASESMARIWQLAGGEVFAVTEDAFSGEMVLQSAVQNIGRLHQPSIEKIVEISPDLLILSADIASHVAMKEQLEKLSVTFAYFSVESFDDYLMVLKTFTNITGNTELFEQNGINIKTKIDDIVQKSTQFSSKKVLILRAGAGKVTARNSKTMAGIMLADMGTINIADNNSLLDILSIEAIIEQDPDYIFIINMGSDEEKSQKVVEETLMSNPAWKELSAVKSGRIITLPKNLFHQKPNENWAKAYEFLWEVLYAD